MLKTPRYLAFLTDKIYNYDLFDKIWNFIIQKLKNKHTYFKKSTFRGKCVYFSILKDKIHRLT